jgi:nitrogen fixation NifU-like protein
MWIGDLREMKLLSEEDQAVLGEVDVELLSPELLRHASTPSNHGLPDHPDGRASVTGICEDTVSIALCLRGRIISAIGFEVAGCGFTTACASKATELARGAGIDRALSVDGVEINRALGGLPKGHGHCADLAANALKAAIRDALTRASDSWKRRYRE